MAAKRTATAVWEGDLTQGQGRVRAASGAVPELPLSWASRTEAPAGKTSPEELIAAAHAGCFAMAFSHALTAAGHRPDQVTVEATSTFDKVDAGFRITTMELKVRAKVPGIDKQKFDEVVRQAEQGCPVSNALRNNVDIRVDAALA